MLDLPYWVPYLAISGAIGIGIGGLVGSLLVLRYRTKRIEEEEERQKTKDAELWERIGDIDIKVVEQGNATRETVEDAEKRTEGKITDLTESVDRKLEEITKIISDHTTQLAVVENDVKHLRRRLDSTANKVAKFPTPDPGIVK